MVGAAWFFFFCFPSGDSNAIAIAIAEMVGWWMR